MIAASQATYRSPSSTQFTFSTSKHCRLRSTSGSGINDESGMKTPTYAGPAKGAVLANSKLRP
jgi:hypothetical protein